MVGEEKEPEEEEEEEVHQEIVKGRVNCPLPPIGGVWRGKEGGVIIEGAPDLFNLPPVTEEVVLFHQA